MRPTFIRWGWERAEKEFRRAIELAPDDPAFHAYYGRFLAAMGRFDQAIDEVERARKLANGPAFDVAAGEVYYWARRYDKAVDLVHPSQGNIFSDFLLGWAYVGQSKWSEARAAFQSALPASGRDSGVLMSLAYVDAASGRRTEVPALLEEVKQKTTLMYVPVYRIAES